jgi:hypothetical protein
MSRKLFEYESKDGTTFKFTFDKKTYNEKNYFTNCWCECRHHGIIEDWESPDFGSILDLIKYYAPIKKIMYTSPEFLELMAIYKEKL